MTKSLHEIKKELVDQCYNSYKPRYYVNSVGSNKFVQEYTNALGLNACVFINHSLSYISLVVRGSDNFVDWVQNLDTNKKAIDVYYSKDSNKFQVVYIHSGYQKVFFNEGVGNCILNQIANLHKEYKYDIYLTGHSMGGAIVQIFAFKLFTEHSIKTISILFGAPLNIGDLLFQNVLAKNKILILHFNVSNDIVPRLLCLFFPTSRKQIVIILKNKDNKNILKSHSILYYKKLLLEL